MSNELDLSTLTVEDSERGPQSNAGRGLSPDTIVAIEWLKASHSEGDGTIGKPKRLVVPAGSSEKVQQLLTRAASALDSGLDKEVNNMKGGKVEIIFQTRPKRQRKEKSGE